MSGRAERLHRLLAVRRLSEDLDRRSLQVALAAVAEVEAAIASQETALRESKLALRSALSDGDRGEWLLADAQIEVAGWNLGRLKTLLCERADAVTAAMQSFLNSRLEHEQVKQLVGDAKEETRRDDDRRAQAAAADWFMSRRTRPTN
jgi:hypothetical protein